jgi:hypothetical protein
MWKNRAGYEEMSTVIDSVVDKVIDWSISSYDGKWFIQIGGVASRSR